MTLRQHLALIIARECSGADSLWPSKLRVVDMLLDEMEPQPECVKQVFWRNGLDHSGFDETLWSNCIAAIKSEHNPAHDCPVNHDLR